MTLDLKEILNLSISLLALILSIFAITGRSKASKAAHLQQIKMSIDNAKTISEERVAAIIPLASKAASSLSADEKRQLDSLRELHEVSIEKVLNAYENGCQNYLSATVNKKDFKKLYFSDIKGFVDDFQEKFRPPVTKYHSMLKVYDEWYIV